MRGEVAERGVEKRRSKRRSSRRRRRIYVKKKIGDRKQIRGRLEEGKEEMD